MPSNLLYPALDSTFKLVLIRNPPLLRYMIESALDLPSTIQEPTNQNPEIPRDYFRRTRPSFSIFRRVRTMAAKST